MNENSASKKRVMEILNKSKYNDEVIDGLDISDLDLTFSDLSEVKAECIMAKRVLLRASSLMRAAFFDCDFEFADFRSCNLEEIHIADCRFGESDFSKANMKFAKVNISSCFKTCFDEVDFSYGEIVGTILNHATFCGANLYRIDAKQTDCTGTDFNSANLQESNFEKAYLEDANLTEVDAKNANFTNADLTGATLLNGDFMDADFTGAKLDRVVWTGANIKGAKFDGNVKEQILKMV